MTEDEERPMGTEETYRGYVIRGVTSEIFDVVQPPLGRHASLAQAKRSIDHFQDRDCRAHRGRCRE